MIEVGYATPIIHVCIQREKETERARHMHTPAGWRPPGNPGSLSGQCMWQRSERVTDTHGIQSSHVGRTRASSDQAGRAGRLACCVLQCAAVCCSVLLCAAVCCSHHCLHSYPSLRSQQTPFQVRVHMSESQVTSLCVSTSYPCVCVNHIPVCVCVCLNHTPACLNHMARRLEERLVTGKSERAAWHSARCVVFICVYMYIYIYVYLYIFRRSGCLIPIDG